MRVVRRRPAAALAATVLAMGALSACGGEPDAEPSTATSTASPVPVDPSSSSSSSTSSSSSSSTSGSSEVPDLPDAATKHTQEGAVAFAKYYWNEQSRAIHEGDTSTLKTLVSDDCAVCYEYIDAVDGEIKAGRHSDVLPTTVLDWTVTSETTGKSDQAITVTAKDRAYKMVDDSGQSDMAPSDPIKYDVIIYVDWVSGAWVVVDSYMLT